MKVGEILRMLQADGWYLVSTRGSHRQFKHAAKPTPGTLNSILKQSGLKS